MKRILLCSQEPLLIKELYGPIRDGGIEVVTTEYISDAVREFLANRYDAVILDTRNIGLNAYEAASIMKDTISSAPIFLLTDSVSEKTRLKDGVYVTGSPKEIDSFLTMFKEIIRNRSSVLI